MLIIGAKGFAKEVLEILYQNNKIEKLAFFDDKNQFENAKIYDQFPILKTEDDVKLYFKNTSPDFCLGLGNPKLRKVLYEKFINMGGQFTSIISPLARIGHFGNTIEEGCNIMTGTIITNDIFIGKGCLINLNCTIGHDSIIEDFVELCPGVHVSGNCKIRANSFVGTNATILPGITIGQNSVIAAGALINKDVPDNALVAGIPGIIKKYF